MTMMKPCPRCKRAHRAILKPDGAIVVLPHMLDGSEREFGKTCGAKL
jgi:hypothetical protein